jgi:hypothetical protein
MGKVVAKKIKFTDLVFLDDNPRTITEKNSARLAKRIKKDPSFFDNRPCLVNFIDGSHLCYAGFQRAHVAAQVLGWKEIPCMVEADVPMKTMRERAIVDNTHDGQWDAHVLGNWEFEREEYDEMGVPDFVFGGSDEAMQMPDESELIGEQKNKSATMKITFPTPDDLQKCEAQIQEAINRLCPNAFYSVSAGEI